MEKYKLLHPYFFKRNLNAIFIIDEIKSNYSINNIKDISEDDYIDITLELLKYLEINLYYNLKTLMIPKVEEGIVFVDKDGNTYEYDCYEFGYYKHYNESALMCWFKNVLLEIYSITEYEEELDLNNFYNGYSFETFKYIINSILSFIENQKF